MWSVQCATCAVFVWLRVQQWANSGEVWVQKGGRGNGNKVKGRVIVIIVGIIIVIPVVIITVINMINILILSSFSTNCFPLASPSSSFSLPKSPRLPQHRHTDRVFWAQRTMSSNPKGIVSPKFSSCQHCWIFAEAHLPPQISPPYFSVNSKHLYIFLKRGEDICGSTFLWAFLYFPNKIFVEAAAHFSDCGFP